MALRSKEHKSFSSCYNTVRQEILASNSKLTEAEIANKIKNTMYLEDSGKYCIIYEIDSED